MLPSAKEAKERSDFIITCDEQKHYEDAIYDAIQNGRDRVRLYGSISQAILFQLIDLGYKVVVDSFDTTDGAYSFTTISWGDANEPTKGN